MRQIVTEGAGHDAHGPHLPRTRVATTIDAAVTDPDDLPTLPGLPHYRIAFAQLFDRHRASIRQNRRARREARNHRSADDKPLVFIAPFGEGVCAVWQAATETDVSRPGERRNLQHAGGRVVVAAFEVGI